MLTDIRFLSSHTNSNKSAKTDFSQACTICHSIPHSVLPADTSGVQNHIPIIIIIMKWHISNPDIGIFRQREGSRGLRSQVPQLAWFNSSGLLNLNRDWDLNDILKRSTCPLGSLVLLRLTKWVTKVTVNAGTWPREAWLGSGGRGRM